MLFGTEIFELKILDAISAAFSCRVMDYIMPKLTVLGNGGVLWILIAVFMLAVKKYHGTGIKLAAALIGCLIAVNIVLKPLVARPRPCWLNESVLLLIKTPHDYSFPSGHAAASFASACVLLTYNKKAGIAALILACLIAFSRMYLYVHFPTDVAAGALIGCLAAAVMPRLVACIRERISHI